MTTYPLSEPATIYAMEGSDETSPRVIGQGTLEHCTDIVAGLSPERLASISIHMDDLDLKFAPQAVGELLKFLREESEGLSNQEIAEIKSTGP